MGKAVEPEGRMEERKEGREEEGREQNISYRHPSSLLHEAVHFMSCFVDLGS